MWGFTVRVWVGDRTETAIFWPPLLWPSALCLSCSPDAQPEAQGPSSLLDDGFLYCFLSATSLDPNSIGGPEGPFVRVWLSLPHLVYNSSDLQLSWQSYIIVQRPLNHLLNLWNGMFDRHQAEITVMQFPGHSLPVHHSEVGPSPCPILSAELTCVISSHNCHWNVSLPSGASLWMAFLAGSKAKIQHKLFFVSSMGFRIHWLQPLQRDKTPIPLLGMPLNYIWVTPSLSIHLVSLWPGVVVPFKVLSRGRTNLFENYQPKVEIVDGHLLCLA